MKKYLIILLLFFAYQPMMMACDLCKENQPKGLEDITHGRGPTGYVDYIITWSALILVAITLFFSIKFLVRPKENGPDHIKNIVWDKNFKADGGQ
ncbi:hypothetical protein KCTC52924_02853 [Arenibacter antarcticus]|uniref:Cbb3-type cytochrome oxidase component FixQ n=1 Tax=Arenibacter antarcticus TaxID=2040469 RepID=A0ABW5VJZ3_9FLAO|nr:hypothetical protein [Arenibacter sp. H213]MCM4167272.1 hypothetical protein [Arenibacter sp. H213]